MTPRPQDEPAPVTTDVYELADLIKSTPEADLATLRHRLVGQIGRAATEALWEDALAEIDRCAAAEFTLTRFAEQLSAAEHATSEAADALTHLRSGLGSHVEYSGRAGKDLAALLEQVGVLLRASQAMNPVEAN